MTRRRSRRQRRWRNAREDAAGTHISSLGDDLMLEIFLLLPSLATLVRAALACRAWRRAVASSPAFRRRFRALHPAPPLLGLFFNTHRLYQPPLVPTFVPAFTSDRDLTAAVRGGDFFLTSLLERSGDAAAAPNWELLDCRGGNVLVADWDEEKLVMSNPLMRRSEREFDAEPVEFDSYYDDKAYPRLACSDEDPASSFHLVLLECDDSKVRASVFSSEAGEWSVLRVDALAWRDDDGTSDDDDESSADDSDNIVLVEYLGRNMMQLQANGFIYWVYRKRYDDGRYLISLNTYTMEFSFAKLPQCLSSCAFEGGETKDGAACIVYLDGLNVGVVKLMREEDGNDRWVPERLVPLDRELERVLEVQRCGSDAKLSLLAVRDGYAYLSASATSSHYPRRPRNISWFMTLCLETMKLEKLFEKRTYEDCRAIPYIMAWPPCLLGNIGRFALEDAP